ncbi:YaiI/YqxD family protein [candidate division KSB3 bacterium]|uniref:UPF0178 protein GF339_03940 n=1 Tax=candidate division KSB3 bacterium TaxID=2044937 RepID=A0A9D5JTB0_9BACT|nr:YaiI/YqxD family protein [candidate division KSB3 bacterium]MBD3323710.1 YaiI/YqxD family protein [candidate division KSB3 bacterium]
MKIFVDGDSCPVKETIVAIAAEKQVAVVFVVSTSGYFDRGWNVQTVMVDSAPQAADIAIINRLEAGDIVVTQDYGLALLVLGKRGKAISPRGRRYTDDNIDRLLQQRQMHAEARKAGARLKGPRKRSGQDTARFSQNFRRLLDECLHHNSEEIPE